jgi:hypothetical protein
MCSNCNTRTANAGRAWCEQCFRSSLCKKCNKNKPAAGHKWCSSCFEKSKQPQYTCLKCTKGTDNELKVCETCLTALVLVPTSGSSAKKRAGILKQFNDTIGRTVTIVEIVTIFDKERFKEYNTYKDKIALKNGDANERRWWHGSRLGCELWKTMKLCGGPSCAICSIISKGFLKSHAGHGRLGPGLYFAPEAQKSNGYTGDYQGVRCLILSKLVVGKPIKYTTDQPQLRACPAGYDSVIAEKGSSFSHAECVLWDEDAILPAYVVFYK